MTEQRTLLQRTKDMMDWARENGITRKMMTEDTGISKSWLDKLGSQTEVIKNPSVNKVELLLRYLLEYRQRLEAPNEQNDSSKTNP